jgi:hypothetical protein
MKHYKQTGIELSESAILKTPRCPPSGRSRYDVICTKVMQEPITRQRYQLDEKIQWNTNGKWGSNFQNPQSLKLKDAP